MMRRLPRALGAATAFVVLALAVAPALARPLYFDQFTALYGLLPGDDLYACGVCHRKWEGTGARNPYGLAVEQQLYLGKSILDGITDIALEDTDGDGFSNLLEVTLYGTLPGYACDTWELANDPPANFQSLITPLVASCLDPHDIAVAPAAINFITEVGRQDAVTVTLTNNGSDEPVVVSSAALLPGAPAVITATEPLPLVIPVGGNATLTVTFAPVASLNLGATLRIESDDPDEPVIDVPISALGVVLPLAPLDDRVACLRTIDKLMRKYAKTHTREWARCFSDEARGRACDAGRRQLKIDKAEAALRAFVGGEKDRECAGRSLSPVLLGLPTTCAAPCDHLVVTNIDALTECLVCTQEASTAALLDAAFGVVPPDLPAGLASGAAASCQKSIATAVTKGVQKVQKTLARCAADNVGAAVPVDCSAVHAASLASTAAKVDGMAARCKDTTGVQACVFQDGGPTCLGDAAVTLGATLVDATFGPAEE